MVYKVKGDENPADLMTKILSVREVVDRLGWMNLKAEIVGERSGEGGSD